MSVTDFSPYINLHESIYENPKTFALADILSQDRNTIVGMLPRLWLWCRRRGSPVVNLPPAALARVMDWDKKPELLQEALIRTGWLDRADDGTIMMHDW